jgi:hypothetical protein
MILGAGTTITGEETLTRSDGLTETSSFFSSYTLYGYRSFDGSSFKGETSESRIYDITVGALQTKTFTESWGETFTAAVFVTSQSTETLSSETTFSETFGVNYFNTSTTTEFGAIVTLTKTSTFLNTFPSSSPPIVSRTFTAITTYTDIGSPTQKIATGFVESTIFAQEAATVLESPHILYVIESPVTTWNGYSTTTFLTATRTTISPSFSTINIVLHVPSSTSSFSVEEISSSYVRRVLAGLTRTTKTSVSRFDILPNSTFVVSENISTTENSYASFTLLPSSSFIYGETVSDGVITTTAITSWLTSVALTQLETSNLIVDEIILKPYSTTISSTTKFGVYKTETASTSFRTDWQSTDSIAYEDFSVTVSGSRSSNLVSASGFSSEEFASSIITLIGPPPVVQHTPSVYIGPLFQKIVAATSGAIVENREGGFFTANQSLSFMSVVLDGNGTHGRTIMPTNQLFSRFSLGSFVPTATYSANGPFITSSSLNGTQTLSTTLSVGVSGQTQTTIGAFLNSRGNVNHSKASVTEIAAAGAYIDAINRATTSFNNGENTTYTGMTSHRIWHTAIQLGSPVGLPVNRTPITGTISLNLAPPLGAIRP